MRTINRVLAAGALALPLSFGAAGMAAADTQPVNPTDKIQETLGKVLSGQDFSSVLNTQNAPGHNDGTGDAAGKFIPF